MKRLAVFVSGAGSTLDNLCEASKQGTLQAGVQSVLCNRLGAKAGEVCKKHGLVLCTIEKHSFGTTKHWSGKLYEWATFCRPDLIILAGFDQRLYVPEQYQGRILNIHPSLLPKYGGKGMYGLKVHQAVLDNGEEYTGCTVHVVDNLYDHGIILGQMKVRVRPDDTPQSLQRRVQEAERILYPLVINHYDPPSLKGHVTTMNFAKYLPQHWRDWINDNKGGRLSAHDFTGDVVLIDFEDGSTIRFNYAFYVEDEEHDEICVFTEHCGYHVFSRRGIRYRRLK